MIPTPALVLDEESLEGLLIKAGCLAAEETVRKLKAELVQDPQEKHILRLRNFLIDRSTIVKPREIWANGHHIRRIELSAKGKPKSTTWFQMFKRESGLGACTSRPSSQHGRLREWCFEDIANAWEKYYALRW